jgi:hypothetical protein
VITTTAIGRIATEDTGWWTCLCGCTPDGDGFYPVLADGTVVEDSDPGVWGGKLFLCGSCNAIIDQDTAQLVDGRGTVAIVGFATPAQPCSYCGGIVDGPDYTDCRGCAPAKYVYRHAETGFAISTDRFGGWTDLPDPFPTADWQLYIRADLASAPNAETVRFGAANYVPAPAGWTPPVLTVGSVVAARFADHSGRWDRGEQGIISHVFTPTEDVAYDFEVTFVGPVWLPSFLGGGPVARRFNFHETEVLGVPADQVAVRPATEGEWTEMQLGRSGAS